MLSYIMFEADTHLRPLYTSILAVYKVFEPLVCFLKGICVHPYTSTPAKLPPDLGSRVHLRSGNDATTACLRPIITSDHFINPYKTYVKCLSYWNAVWRAYGCTIIPLHRQSCLQIRGFRFTWGVEMMPQRDAWGWYPPHTTSHIPNRKCLSH